MNDINKDINTENKILCAARKIFIKKGREGARMQEIADEAGVNKAMVHYYFRNKETIYLTICEKLLTELFDSLRLSVKPKDSFKSFLMNFIEAHSTFLNKNSDVLAFTFWEIRKDDDIIKKVFKQKYDVKGSLLNILIDQLKTAEKKGEVRKNIDPLNLLLNLLSLNIFVYLTQPLAISLLDLNKDVFSKIIENRKEEVFRLIWNDIRNN